MPKMVMKRVGIISVAKIQAVLTMIFGLFFSLIYGLFILISGVALFSMGGDAGAIGGASVIIIGLVFIIGIPIGCGIIGFFAGLINGLIYNIVAGIAGGIEMEFEDNAPQYFAPPPPPSYQQQWSPNPQGASNPRSY